jgi:hypothetical protein
MICSSAATASHVQDVCSLRGKSSACACGEYHEGCGEGKEGIREYINDKQIKMMRVRSH